MNISKQKYQELPVLESLKRDYNQGIMSAFIGAGFSLNVSEYYLTWNGLLYDMVCSIHKDKIDDAYKEYKKRNRNIKNRQREEDFTRDYVPNIINKEGALSIASQYVRIHNNMHESIDAYIEEHIPYAKIEEDGIHLFKNDKEVCVCDKQCLSLHRLLLQCTCFRDFYTTNYDNLLEIAIDPKGEPIKIIKQGRELSNTSADKRIIKIHGSLSGADNCTQGFDGYNNERFVITQEDYNNYTINHTAFKSVLQTDMLQGVFCLIGFSGTDPNFRDCINWLLKILGTQDRSQVKFYLVDLSEEPPVNYLNAFYKNNCIEIVRLRDRKIMEQMGIILPSIEEKKEFSISNKSEVSNYDLLEAFLTYLKKSHINSNDYIEVPTYDQSLSSAKCSTFDYKKHWESGLHLLRKKEDLSQLILKLKEFSNTIRFCRIIFPQKYIVDQMMNKESLTEEKAFLFTLAVKEIGQIPSYYYNYHKDDKELNKQPLWMHLIERENTLNGSIEILSEAEEDWAIYEHIQRCLFNLDFTKSKNLVQQWKAQGHWIQNKAMRMAVYEDHLEEAQRLLDNAIERETNPIEKLYEIILANFISRKWPQPYSTDDFWKYGLNGQGDMLNFMMADFSKKKEKPKRRGWIGSTWNLGNNHGDYVKSLRILQYIIDSGIYVSIPGTYMLDVANWYIVFGNLYEYFPYPCFFYSIQYNDKDVQRRIGEEYAYNEKLQDFNQDILLKALVAIGNEDTPISFKKGIFNVTATMYIAVDESVWFEVFKDTVFKLFLQELHGIKDSSELVFNVKYALGSIKNSDNISWVFQELLSKYSINKNIISDIIVYNLMIERIQNKMLINDTLLFSNVLNGDSLNLLDTLNKEGFLSEVCVESIGGLVCNAAIEDIPHNRVALFQIFNLVKGNVQALDKVKQCFLSMNIWHCGVLDNSEFGWTEPMYIRLNLLNDKITWTDDEFEIIKVNLIKNVSTYSKVAKSLHNDSFMKNIQVRYLSDMLKFIDGLNGERHEALLYARKEIERLFLERTQYADNIDLMMSEQSAEVDYAFENIYEGVIHNGIEQYQDDVDFLIDRAIMQRPIALTRNLKCIKLIVKENCKKMMELGYTKKLNKLLSVYKDADSWSLLDLRFAFNYLYFIAKAMKDSGESNSAIDFWLGNTFVNKFVVES